MKKKLTISLLSMCVLIFLSSFSFLQKKTNTTNRVISGIVRVIDFFPPHGPYLVAGASIMAYDGNVFIRGTQSNWAGQYSISLPENITKLEYSYAGTTTVSVNINNNSFDTIDVMLYEYFED